jgi:hypothetical protein
MQSEPPPGFPDMNSFTSADPSDYTLGGAAFMTPQQVSCVLDAEPSSMIVCSGNIRGLPSSLTGTGCPRVSKPDGAASDTAYALVRTDHPCASSRFVPIGAGQKLTAGNGTCAVGDNGLVACIDNDNKHGFVLQPSGSWTF